MLMDIGSFQVCIDYAHNPAGCRALSNTLRQLNPKRLVGVIAAPGDRRNDVIISLGREAGQGFNKIYIKEDADLRGRQPGETAALLKQGVMEAGLDPECIQTVLDESRAVAVALSEAEVGDLIAIFYEDYDTVSSAINEFSPSATHSAEVTPVYQELIVAGVRVEG